ncbi:MAG: HEAT repeat domain-containing protein [Chloroflexi bacterium]|nr:HEAT repeat domain-containing protein [Chloroflexota bacterium]
MPLPIEETIAALSDSAKPLLSSRLTELSNLNAQELALFEQAWKTIEPKRRRQIIYRLVELAEDNFELDFDDIFKNRLKDEDADVQSKAIEGLWESEETCLIDPLIELLEPESPEKVQATAATALGKFAILAELEKLRPKHKTRVCRTLLGVIEDTSRSIEIKRRALEAAAPLSLPQMEKAIARAYRSGVPRLKTSAIFAMGKRGDPRWLPILIKELTNADAEIRYEAASACGELGEKETAPYLSKLTTDPDIDVQLAAIQALGKIGGPEAKDSLERCLTDDSEVIQQAAEEALNELGADENPLSFRM